MIPKKHRAWAPILTGSLKTQVVEAIDGIADALQDPPRLVFPEDESNEHARAVQEVSVSGGRSGYALLFDYLARSEGNHRYKKYSAMFLEDAVEAVAEVQMDASLYSGFTGVGWTVAHLHNRAQNELKEVDDALYDHVKRSPWKSDYDLINGLVGFGVYALERLHNRRAALTARRCLARIVNRLEEMAVETSDGLAWFASVDLLPEWQRKEAPAGYYNLGLAHGIPGVIALLGHAYAAGVQRRKTRMLLQDSVNWLLKQKLPPDAASCFSSWVGPGIDRGSSRSAWCYGDPGIAIALLSVARSVGEKSWEEEALKIARRAAERPHNQSGVRDAGLCHGSAGLAHIFNRIYQATGENLFHKAAHFWFKRTLEFRQQGKGIAGFQSYFPERDGTVRWVDDPGLLTGAAGIALALHAAVTSVEPEWDSFLLTTIRTQ
jgi:lantibiotic biosynthesis protein